LNFSQIFGIFPTCFDNFLPANTTNITSLNYKNFTIPFLPNKQSLETCSLRDRDSEKWVSRPRPCLETPSLSVALQSLNGKTTVVLMLCSKSCLVIVLNIGVSVHFV